MYGDPGQQGPKRSGPLCPQTHPWVSVPGSSHWLPIKCCDISAGSASSAVSSCCVEKASGPCRARPELLGLPEGSAGLEVAHWAPATWHVASSQPGGNLLFSSSLTENQSNSGLSHRFSSSCPQPPRHAQWDRVRVGLSVTHHGSYVWTFCFLHLLVRPAGFGSGLCSQLLVLHTCLHTYRTWVMSRYTKMWKDWEMKALNVTWLVHSCSGCGPYTVSCDEVECAGSVVVAAHISIISNTLWILALTSQCHPSHLSQ